MTDVPEGISPPPIRRGDLGARGEVLAAAGSEIRMVWGETGGLVLAWDRVSGRAVALMNDPPGGYELVSPLRFLVHWAVAAAGGVLVHGAAVGRSSTAGSPARGLLLLGEAGFGKSTSTLACLEAGWVTCGDDAVAVLPDDLGWRAAPIYAAVKTKLDAADERVIGPQVVTWTIAGRKRAHLLSETEHRHLANEMRIDGLVLLAPEAGADEPWEPIGPAAARTLAAPSTAIPLPLDRDAVLTRMGDLAREVQAFRLPRRATLDRTVEDLGAILEDARPRISVLLPVYNGARFLMDALTCIAEQTTGQFEILAVDDASTDGSPAVIQGARHLLEARGHSLTVITHDVNRGVAAARNTGLAATTCELITFLDQDDLWTADRTELLVTALRRSDAGAAYGRMSFRPIVEVAHRDWMRSSWFAAEDHRGNVMGAGLFRRSAFDIVGHFDEANRSGNDDVDWVVRLRDSECRVVEIDRLALVRRMHDTNQSRFVKNPDRDLLAIVRAHRQRVTPAPLVPIDVVIPAHGVLRYLRAAAESALGQVGADVRVIVVDDGNDGDLAATVAAWGDSRVTVVRHDANRGIGAARNTGAAQGDRPWIGFLDADDLWPVARTRDLIAVLGGTDRLDMAVGSQLVFNDGADPDPTGSFEVTDEAPAPLAGAMLFRRSVLEAVGPFDEHLRVGEMVDWMARARVKDVLERPVRCVSLLRRSHVGNTTRSRTADFADYLTVVARARERSRARTEA